jgi:rRNA-processing protein FCF1
MGIPMANLQVKNIPAAVHKELPQLARRQDRTIRELVLAAIERELSRARVGAQLAKRSSVDLRGPASKSLASARRERDLDLTR